MRRWFRLTLLVLPAFFLLPAAATLAQTPSAGAKQPQHARVALYRITPGQQLNFLKWVAAAEADAKEAGVPASQFFAHTNGDHWDYMQIAPNLSDSQQAKVDEMTRKRGGKTGFPAGLEVRAFFAWHTDTEVMGPMTAADLVAAAGK